MNCLYYTDGIVLNKATLTKLCFLFEHVRTFFLSPSYFLDPLEERWATEKDQPFFAKSPCERDLLTSIYVHAWESFLRENSDLIKCNVLQPIAASQTPPDWESFEANEKRLMENGAGIGFGLWGQSVGLVPQEKIYIDAPWFSLYRWQSISGALHFAIQTQHIPISDNYHLSTLASETVTRFSDLAHNPTPDEIAGHIAFRSMSLLIPDFPPLETEEILEAREKLSDELGCFRTEMLSIAKKVGPDAYGNIDAIVAEKVQPGLDDIKLKSKSLKGELFRKLSGVFFMGGGTPLLSHLVSLPLAVQIPAIIGLIGKALLDVHEYKDKQYELGKQSSNQGLAFLLDVEKKYGSR